MSTKVFELNDSNFDEEVLCASEPVLVGFEAQWSSSCQAMATHLNSVAEEEAATVKVAKVDVDRSPAVASRYGVRAVPTLLVFHRGFVREQIVGAATAAQLREVLAPFGFSRV